MVTERQIAANRRNAKRSTGPKTEAGKAVQRLNATTHGLTSTIAAVVPAIDDVAEWERHQVATIEALGPVGAVEQALAERVAALLWRLGRAQKFEAGLIQNAQEAVEDDIHRHRQLFGDGLPGSAHPAELRDRVQAAASTDRALARVLDQPGSTPVKADDALAIVRRAFDSAEVTENVPLPGVSDESALEDPGEFIGFTADRVRACIAAVAAVADIPPEELVELMRMDARLTRAVTCAKVEASEREVAQWRRRILPFEDPVGAFHEKLARHEAALERSLFKTLRELREMQAARQAKSRAQDRDTIEVAGSTHIHDPD